MKRWPRLRICIFWVTLCSISVPCKGCNLDVSIDSYDVGGWVVYGGQELTIERPAYEAKKFTFYRVKAAPKEAGIESGRDENGLVKCVFTPEAFLDIAVAVSSVPHPLEVNIAPDATVGDLKRQVQSQLNAANDPDQLLVLNDKVLSNPTCLRSVYNNYAKCIQDALLRRRYLASRSCAFFLSGRNSCRVSVGLCLGKLFFRPSFFVWEFVACLVKQQKTVHIFQVFCSH